MKEKRKKRWDEALAWKTGEPALVHRTRIFDLLSVQTYAPSGKGPYEYTVLRSPDWMNVIPITPSGEVVLIEQFRHGISGVTLEVPGGQVDPGETPEECAVRELIEETGYRAKGLAYLGKTLPNPAFLSNACHTFLATGCVQAGAPRPEDTEAIQVRLEPLEAIPSLIAGGRIEHALVVVAFTHLSLRRPDLLRLAGKEPCNTETREL